MQSVLILVSSFVSVCLYTYSSLALYVPCFDQILVGAFISSLSVFFLTMSQHYWAEIVFVVVLAIGEAIWSPRLYEYFTRPINVTDVFLECAC